MEFGLYSTSRLIQHVGIKLDIHSGNYVMLHDGINVEIAKTTFWQGTIVYFELHSNKEIDPNEIVENRTDCESQFNDEFVNTEDLEELW